MRQVDSAFWNYRSTNRNLMILRQLDTFSLTGNWARRTKTCVPCPLAPTGHSQNKALPVTCYNGLGAARGQRLRKESCASYPTRFCSSQPCGPA